VTPRVILTFSPQVFGRFPGYSHPCCLNMASLPGPPGPRPVGATPGASPPPSLDRRLGPSAPARYPDSFLPSGAATGSRTLSPLLRLGHRWPGSPSAGTQPGPPARLTVASARGPLLPPLHQTV
jgi:hypothetical protein